MSSPDDAMDDVRSRARGILCGSLVGDALGAAFEGESSASISRICASLGLGTGLVDITPAPSSSSSSSSPSSSSLVAAVASGAIRVPSPCVLVDSRTFPDAVASAACAGIDLMAESPSTVGFYTDDTELTFALAQTLVEFGFPTTDDGGGSVDRGQLAAFGGEVAVRSALWFARPPDRGGYSSVTFRKLVSLQRRARELDVDQFWAIARSPRGLRQLLDGENAALSTSGTTSAVADTFDDIADDGFCLDPNGSFGNGAPMRIAPLGFALRSLVSEGNLRAVRDIVFAAVSFSHAHPEAVDAATVLCTAVARCASLRHADVVNPVDFVAQLASECQTGELRTRLTGVAEGLQACTRMPREGDSPMLVSAEKELLQRLCTPDKWFQIRAVDALCYVLFVFCRYGGLDSSRPCPSKAVEALVRMIALGGDTDTLSCMLGALLGALHGDSWVPAEWIAEFEPSEDHGWPKALALGDLLAETRPCVSLGTTLAECSSSVRAAHAELVTLREPVRHDL